MDPDPVVDDIDRWSYTSEDSDIPDLEPLDASDFYCYSNSISAGDSSSLSDQQNTDEDVTPRLQLSGDDEFSLFKFGDFSCTPTTTIAVNENDKEIFRLETNTIEVNSIHSSDANRLIVDSGAASHVGNTSSMFSSREKTNTIVVFPDGGEIPATSEGTMSLETDKSFQFNLLESLYLPEFKKCLFSVPRAASNGAIIVFDKNPVKVIDEKTKELVFSGNCFGDLYYIQLKNILQSISPTQHFQTLRTSGIFV